METKTIIFIIVAIINILYIIYQSIKDDYYRFSLIAVIGWTSAIIFAIQ